MLAQNFKTAAELKIDPRFLTALQKVLVRLETGDLVHVIPWVPHWNTLPNGFNMGVEWDKGECGTAGCMLGWAAAEMGVRWFDVMPGFELPLHGLFSPGSATGCLIDYDAITPDQAAIVLRHYLTTGEVNWFLIPIKRLEGLS